MKGYVKILALVVVAAVAVAACVYTYFLLQPRLSLLVYPDSKVAGCKKRLNETVILHVRNDGNIDLYVNSLFIESYGGLENASATYTFQSDIVIPIGVEAVIIFPASGGEVVIETISGPSGAAGSGGVYAISDNPDPNPFGMWQATLHIHTRSGVIGGYGGVRVALTE